MAPHYLLPFAPVISDSQLPPGDRNRQQIQRMPIAAWPPGMRQLVAIAIELDAVGRRPDLASFEQYLEGFAGGDASTELAGHDGGGAATFLEIDAGLVRQVMAMQQGGGKADQKAHGFFQFGPTVQMEVVFEAHAAGQEIEQRGAHAEGGDGHRWDAVLGAIGENPLTRIESEEVKAIDIEVHVLEEGLEIALVHALRVNGQVGFWVDVPRHFGQDFNFGTFQAAHTGAGLAIEVGKLEYVEIGYVKFFDTEAGEGHQMETTDAPHTGDGHPLVPQALLLIMSNPADIA